MSTDPRPLPPLPPMHPLPALDYADARPIASQLHCETAGDGVRVWRDPPPRHMLVAELVNPLICLTFLGGWILIVVIMAARAGLENLPSLARLHPLAALSVLPACGLFVYFVLDAWQNAGIVTRIEVADGSFTWTKQTLFGERNCRWRAQSITAVRVPSVGTLNLLRVRRRGGFPLGAFSRCRREEVDWAADALRAALGLVDR